MDNVKNTVSNSSSIVVLDSLLWGHVCLWRHYSVTSAYICLLWTCCLAADVVSLFHDHYAVMGLHTTIFWPLGPFSQAWQEKDISFTLVDLTIWFTLISHKNCTQDISWKFLKYKYSSLGLPSIQHTNITACCTFCFFLHDIGLFYVTVY
jgi:hypothetical protein